MIRIASRLACEASRSRWHLIAPDFPGCGCSGTPDHFRYDFDGYADFLDRLMQRLDVPRFALYLHDFGSQIGLRLAISRPHSITALVIQNGDIDADVLGPKYEPLLAYFRNPTAEAKTQLVEAVSEEGFKDAPTCATCRRRRCTSCLTAATGGWRRTSTRSPA